MVAEEAGVVLLVIWWSTRMTSAPSAMTRSPSTRTFAPGRTIAGAGMNKDGTGSTMQAAASLKAHGFAMGSALELTVDVWTSQSKAVLQACAHISNHLDYSKKLHAEDDAKIAAVLRSRDGLAESVSELSKYFK